MAGTRQQGDITLSNGGSFCCFVDGNLHKNVLREISTVNYGNVHKLQRPGLLLLLLLQIPRCHSRLSRISRPSPFACSGNHQPPIEGPGFLIFNGLSLSRIRGSFLPFICDWILEMQVKGFCICLPCQPVTRTNKGQGLSLFLTEFLHCLLVPAKRVGFCRDFNLFLALCLLSYPVYSANWIERTAIKIQIHPFPFSNLKNSRNFREDKISEKGWGGKSAVHSRFQRLWQ